MTEPTVEDHAAATGYTVAEIEAMKAAAAAQNTANLADQAATTAHRDRLSAPATLDRLREIRDTAETGTVTELRVAVKDLTRWCLEAGKWLADDRGAAEG